MKYMPYYYYAISCHYYYYYYVHKMIKICLLLRNIQTVFSLESETVEEATPKYNNFNNKLKVKIKYEMKNILYS